MGPSIRRRANSTSRTARWTSGPAPSGWRDCSRIPATACVPASTAGCELPSEPSRALCWFRSSAVIDLQGTHQVAVVDSDNKVNIRTVSLGDTVGNEWIVSDGLKPGERVVAEGVQKVRQGMQVNPKPLAKRGNAAMSKFFINRPIVAMVIAILTVIVGAVAIAGLPVAQFPAIAPPEVQVSAIYVGADAQTIEQSVATPIEQQMSGVDNMNYMYSLNATANGQMRMIVDFDVATDPNTDLILAQSRETQAASQLPADVTNYGVTVQKSVLAPLMLVALYSPKGTYDAKFLANYAYINLNDPLTRVKGVGTVQVFGAGQYAMRLWVKPDQLAKLQITVPEIVSAHPDAEHRQPRRTGGQRADSQRAAVHLFGARAGPSDLARRVRADRGPRNARHRHRARDATWRGWNWARRTTA